MQGKTETLMFIPITLTASHHSWPSFHWSRLVSLKYCCNIWFLWSTPKKPSLTGLPDVILSSSTVCLCISKVILHFYWRSLYLRFCTSVIQVIYLLTHSCRSLDSALLVVLKLRLKPKGNWVLWSWPSRLWNDLLKEIRLATSDNLLTPPQKLWCK